MYSSSRKLFPLTSEKEQTTGCCFLFQKGSQEESIQLFLASAHRVCCQIRTSLFVFFRKNLLKTALKNFYQNAWSLSVTNASWMPEIQEDVLGLPFSPLGIIFSALRVRIQDEILPAQVAASIKTTNHLHSGFIRTELRPFCWLEWTLAQLF